MLLKKNLEQNQASLIGCLPFTKNNLQKLFIVKGIFFLMQKR